MRTVEKQLSVVAELRTRIVGGVFPPGTKLPTRTELEQEFGVSAATLQGAMDHLSRDGFIESKGRNGTFVAETAPWLSTFAVLMPDRLETIRGQVCSFWTAILNELYAVEKAQRVKLPVSYGFGPLHLRPDEFADFTKIIADLRAHRLGGLIFVTNPEYFDGTPLATEPVPRVAVKNKALPGVPAVYPDLRAMIERSLDYLKARGRRAIAVAGITFAHLGGCQWIESQIAARGMISRQFWNLQLDPNQAENVRVCANLLMHCSERPDGILIADDNLVPNFTAGLLASGVRTSDHLEIVAHANFPWPTQSMVPVRRIGFDVHRLLEVCIEIIAAQRDGKPVPELTLLPPVMQDE